jgi:peptidoglycan/LPS O-acetylase OafA/YrhL
MPLIWLGYRLRAAHTGPVFNIAALLLYVPLSIGLAALLHVAIERPSHRLGRHLARARRRKCGEIDPVSKLPTGIVTQQAALDASTHGSV